MLCDGPAAATFSLFEQPMPLGSRGHAGAPCRGLGPSSSASSHSYGGQASSRALIHYVSCSSAGATRILACVSETMLSVSAEAWEVTCEAEWVWEGEEATRINLWETDCRKYLQKSGGRSPNFISSIAASLAVISPSSQASIPYTNYSCQQLNVFIQFCLLYYSTFIPLFSTHLFTRIKAYSDRIIPLHNKNKSQHLHTHHSHSKSTAKL